MQLQSDNPLWLLPAIPRFTDLILSSNIARKAKTRKTKINAPWLTTYVLSGAIEKKKNSPLIQISSQYNTEGYLNIRK